MSRLEAQLHAMDKTDFANGDSNYLMSCTEDEAREELPRGWTESRGKLLERMRRVAADYGKNLTLSIANTRKPQEDRYDE